MAASIEDIDIASMPAVVQFSSSNDDESNTFLPSDTNTVTFSLRLNAATKSAFAKLRVDIPAKASRRPVPIFLYVNPERIVSLTAEDATEPPPAIRSQLSTTLIRLDVTLRTPADLIAPSQPPVPKNKAAGDALVALDALAAATSFAIYIPSTHLPRAQAQSLCKLVRDGALRTLESEKGTAHLYQGKGAKVCAPGALIGTMAKEKAASGDGDVAGATGAGAESPPSYDELGLSPLPAKKRRVERSASSDAKPSAGGSRALDAVAIQALCQETCRQMLRTSQAEQQARIDERIRQSVQALEARLQDRIDSRIESMRQEMDAARQEQVRTREAVRESLEVVRDEQQEGLWEVRERIEDVREELKNEYDKCKEAAVDEGAELADQQCEERFYGLKIEMREFVEEELQGVEERIKGGLADMTFSLDFNS